MEFETVPFCSNGPAGPRGNNNNASTRKIFFKYFPIIVAKEISKDLVQKSKNSDFQKFLPLIFSCLQNRNLPKIDFYTRSLPIMQLGDQADAFSPEFLLNPNPSKKESLLDVNTKRFVQHKAYYRTL